MKPNEIVLPGSQPVSEETAGTAAALQAPEEPGGTCSPCSVPQTPQAPATAPPWHLLPQELRDRRQWLLAGANDAGELKVPRSLNRTTWTPCAGSHSEPLTWLDYETARAAADHFGLGLGYVLHKDDPYTCVDFDVKNASNAPNNPEKWTGAEDVRRMQMLVEDLDSYTELSQSGQGVHVWVRGKIGEGLKKRGVELYSQQRFIVCTGRSIHEPAKPIEDRQAEVSELAAAMRGPDAVLVAHMDLADVPTAESDEVLIERARSYANASKFNALWNGEWAAWTEPGNNGEPRQPYPSQSEADMALMGILCMLSKSNEQCRRLFLSSELGQREKAQGRHGGRYLNYMLRKIRARQAAEDARRVDRWERSKAVGEGTLEPMTAPVMNVAEMCQQLVFVRKGSAVAWREMPRRHYPAKDAANIFSGCFEERTDSEGKKKNVRCFSLWKDAGQKRVDVETLTFDPRFGTFCADPAGDHSLNLWKPRPHNAPADWQALAQPFLDHVAYLVPVEAERERFLSWLAHIEHRPGELPHYGYLMVALKQGVGRNWVAAVLAHVWRGHVALSFDLKQTLEKGYNGQLSRKLLAVVDEINEGRQNDQWPHAEKLKEMVTAPSRRINEKYGLQWDEHNCCRWLLFSNHLSAIPLNDTDRRWQVIRNPEQPRPAGYYAKLYALLDDPAFIAAVREWFLRRSLSQFNPGEAPTMNEAKRAMVEVARSDAAEMATELVRTWPVDVMTAPEFGRQLYGDDLQKRSSQVKHRAQEAGIVRWRGPKGSDAARLRVPGEPEAVRVWVLRNPERWAQADSGAIQAELARGAGAHGVAGVARVLPFPKPY
jgi:primase-polymerase (primpol)-like protein